MNVVDRTTNVVITMAGEGSRFRQAGYTVPKYEIKARGRSLFAWSMESLRSCAEAGCRFIFVARSHTNVEQFVAAECSKLGIDDFRIATLNVTTDGQATTAMLAEPLCSSLEHPLAIYNIDTYVDPEALNLAKARGQGWIPCFPGEGDKWSFAACDERGRVSEVREKKRISAHATVGLYWFDSFLRYQSAYAEYYSRPGNLEARERYVAPIYNQLILDKAAVYLDEIAAKYVYPLGTPEDVRRFQECT
jgi:NDP-sugar pyrophosphorylase family protein